MPSGKGSRRRRKTPSGQKLEGATRGGVLVRTLEEHKSEVNAVAVTADGRYVVSGSDDQTVKVWNFATFELTTTFNADEAIYCCAATPDGRTIVAGGASGRLHILRLEGV